MAENAIQGQRRVLMCEAFAELQNRDEMYRQLEAQIEEDERLHTEWMNSILHQGQAETSASDLNWYKKANCRGLLSS